MIANLFSVLHSFFLKIKNLFERILTFLALNAIYLCGIGVTSLISKIFGINFFETAHSKQKDSNWRPFKVSRHVEKMY